MQAGQRIAIFGMVVSAALASLKIVVALSAHSTSLMADGFESSGDVFASGLVLLGLTVAAKPADWNHPYGHGRAETLTGLLIGFILFAGGIAIAAHAILGAKDVIRVPSAYAVWPLIVSIVVKSGLLSVKYRYGRKIGSAALLADAANDGIDMLSAMVALAALGLALSDPVRFLRADHYGAFFVGLIVVFTGIRVTHETSLHLMDTMPDEDLMAQIRQVARSVPGAAGVEKCFARKTGLQYHVDLHLEVNPDITVRESHKIAKQARDKIRAELPWVADVLVHVEPAPEPLYLANRRSGAL